ncbi:MAG: 16S rRNA (adenine(1518)-N(6)/adenine(1519)-N(6))-dimethyltransferase RsmA [Proteobacteria bacterium]|nr:16S rRNA (adenine(1518)-N(6)/adenine(1519)-N(6))-dimethyltransferase RsmA [Pseudomonadota bacterium]
MSADPLPPLREVIAASGLSAKKSLGQNFLLDLNITRKIARAVPNLENAHVLEVGPGPGGLARGLLLEGAAKVTAIEKDARCIPALEQIQEHYPERFCYHIGDALEADEKDLLGEGNLKPQIAANLPYNIASAFLVKWLEGEPWPPFWHSLTVMLQKEVALRLVAGPGTRTYGRLSVLAQWRSTPRILFHIPPEAFTPKPKVTSSVIQIIPSHPAAGLTGKEISAFTQTLFGQRRKILRNVLRPFGETVGDVLATEGINPGLRPENLSVEEICRLAKKLIN